MSDRLYQVYVNHKKVAGNMTLEIALILTKALFQEYFNDHTVQICILEEEKVEVNDND